MTCPTAAGPEMNAAAIMIDKSAHDFHVVQRHNPQEAECNIGVGKRVHDIRARRLVGEMWDVRNSWWALVDTCTTNPITVPQSRQYPTSIYQTPDKHEEKPKLAHSGFVAGTWFLSPLVSCLVGKTLISCMRRA